jgi:hypothetical protein
MQLFPLWQISIDEFIIPYKSTFLHPEHGRFVSTYFCHILFQQLPIWYNKHPLDLLTTVVYPLQTVTVLIITTFLTLSFFIFSKYSILKNNFKLSFTHSIVYFMIGCYIFYQCNEIPPECFFDYIASLLVLLPFMMVLFYYLVSKEAPTKRMVVIECILSMFTALTVEYIIIPLIMFLTVLFLFSIISQKKTKDEIQRVKNKTYWYVYGIFILFSTIYLCMPIDHDKTIEIPKNFGEVFINHLISNVNLCITDQSFLLIIFTFLCVLVLFFRTKNDIKISISSLVCLLSFYIFYVLGCSIMPTIFLYFHDDILPKQLVLLNVTLLFYSLILLDYIFFRIEEKYKINSKILKNILITFFVCSSILYFCFGQNKIKDLIDVKVDNFSKSNYNKWEFYRLDKTILKQKENDIIYLPDYSKTSFSSYLYTGIAFYSYYFIYFQNIYGIKDLKSKKLIVTDKQMPEKLTEDEEKSLKFSNLLERPIKKINKKNITAEWDFNIIDKTPKN